MDLSENYLEQSLSQLSQFEGSVPWMYLDTVGKVTVGVGLMLPDVTAAQALPFTAGERAATPDEIASEFHRVSSLQRGRLPHFYSSINPLQLPPEIIMAKLREILLAFESRLREALTGYDNYPPTAKQGLLDMAYNLGPAGLLHGYPTLIKAVEAGNWSQAAACCSRRGPSPARNAWTKARFLAAMTLPTIHGFAESLAVRVGRLFWWVPERALRAFAR